MPWFRSRSNPSAPPPSGPAELHETKETIFRVGDRVKIGQNGSWSAGSTGEVIYVGTSDSGHSYEVALDNYGVQVDVSAGDLEIIASYSPHVFQLGNRVRLAQEFAGNIWHTEPDFVAGEGDGPEGRGDPVTFPAGMIGTVSGAPQGTSQPSNVAQYVVAMEAKRATLLVVRGTQLEHIPGRTRIVTGPDGLDHVVQLFNYHDVVRLRKQLTGEDGSIFEAGLLGSIDVVSLSTPVTHAMAECWETGIYTIRLFNDELGRERGTINVHTSALQLDSDFRPSPYASDPRNDEPAEADPESAEKWQESTPVNSEGPQQATNEPHVPARITSNATASSMHDLWAFVVAAGEDDQEAADEILARGDHVQMLSQATAQIMANLREQGNDPVAFGRAMIEVVTEKEAKGGF